MPFDSEPMRDAFFGEIKKEAARAGLKLIRSLVTRAAKESDEVVKANLLAKAERLGADPRVLKQVAGGHQVKSFGRGSEGAAELVAGAQQSAGAGKRGLQVRKVYDPNSPIASEEMIRRKMQLSKEFKHPALAEVYGGGTAKGGLKQTFHEYVPGASPTRGEFAAMRPELEQMVAAARQKGYLLGDVRGANVVGGKAVDVMPFRPGEFQGQVKNVMYPTSEGAKVLGMGHGMGSGTAPELFRQAAGTQQQAVRGLRKVRGARAEAGETAVRAAPEKVRRPVQPLSPKAQRRAARRQQRREEASLAAKKRISSEAVSPPQAVGTAAGGAPAATGAGATGAGGWAPPPNFFGGMPSFSSFGRSVQMPGMTSMMPRPQSFGAAAREMALPVAAAGALGAGAYGVHRARQKTPKAPAMRKAASVRRLDRATENGLIDEMQKLADFAGLVLSQLARREITPPVMDAVARAEARAKQKWDALQ